MLGLWLLRRGLLPYILIVAASILPLSSVQLLRLVPALCARTPALQAAQAATGEAQKKVEEFHAVRGE